VDVLGWDGVEEGRACGSGSRCGGCESCFLGRRGRGGSRLLVFEAPSVTWKYRGTENII
jgi:hypothetical protein